ncbi:MAG: hypothetical protein AMXMBFR64_22960 [Myxococcales bacterium]
MRTVTILGLLAVLSAPAHAVIKVYKHDQFSEDLTTAAQQVQGTPLATQPGFAGGEAFGQLYVPEPTEYPVKILGIDLILAAPPNAPGLTTHADIEIWNDTGTDAKPASAAPVFSISTTELLNPSTLTDGIPLQGNTALSISFDYDSSDAVHPPYITEGTIRVMIRYPNPAKEMTNEWGTFQCASQPALGFCGCQNVGLLLDQTTTAGANLLNHITPIGTCNGPAGGWLFMEKAGVTGDIIMRLRAEVTGGGCTPVCAGKQCGSDGCGGVCGTCGAGQDCVSGTCQGGCAPSCAGKVCGPDGCGGSCGDCAPGQTCNLGACAGGCVPDCAGKVCGPDGCGATCGTCAAGQACSGGQCSGTCAPDCAGKTCGADGCGGSCGLCGAGQECIGGGCITTGGTVKTLTVTGISPSQGYNDVETAVAITGTGFVPGMSAKLGGTSLGSVKVTGDSLIDASVPKGMEPGTYMLVVVTPDDRSATLLNAFMAQERAVEPDASDPGPSCGDQICQATESCATCPGDCGPCGVADGGCASAPGAPLAPLAPAGAALLLLVGLAALRPRER